MVEKFAYGKQASKWCGVSEERIIILVTILLLQCCRVLRFLRRRDFSTVQYRFTIPFYAGAVGAHEITQPEEKLAKMKTLPKMSHHGSGGEAARLARYARARASGIAVAMRPP